MSRLHVRRIAVALAFVIAVATGCGISANDEPIAILDTALPPDLIGSESDEPATANVLPVTIYLVGPDDRLVAANREDVRAPEFVMRQLLLGATIPEVQVGINTAISRSTTVPTVVPANPAEGIWHVTFAEGTRVASTQAEQRLAFAQIVYTLTELEGINQVVFFNGDQLVTVPTDSGVSTPGQGLDRSLFTEVGPLVAGFPVEGDAPIAPTAVPNIPATLATPIPDARTEAITIWLVNADDNLARYLREVEREPSALLGEMLKGPSILERETGVRSAVLESALPVNLDVAVDVNEAAGIVFLDLASDSLPPFGNDKERLLAVAQIVYTLTELAEIDGVRITVDGLATSMPTQDGVAPPDAILTRAGYSSLSSLEAGAALPPSGDEQTPELPTATPITPTPIATPTPS